MKNQKDRRDDIFCINPEKSTGITLVALVITIIVLLILAGVSLSLVAGSNGIMSRATSALEKYNMAAIGEEVELAMTKLQMDYLAEKYGNANITRSDTFGAYVSERLQNGGIETRNGKITSTDGTTVIYENIDGNKIATGTLDIETGSVSIAGIITDGDVTPEKPEPTEVLATEAIKSENYGDAVNYAANGINDWQVFLNDGVYIYLISSNYVPSSGMTITSDVAKVDGSDYKMKGNSRDRFISWLTNAENWNAYASGFKGATATGGPSKQQFAESYNAKYGTSHSAGLADSFIVTDKVAPYIISDTSIAYGYWTTSAVSNESSKLWDIDAWGAFNPNDYNRTNYAIRPLIRLPEGVLAIKTNNVWIFSEEEV